ncbi:MAG TPA: F0F1 ATP synthase subunit B [Streptosporangiaceae bacterium]|nr:F0F1 ATP synthase subunit B [Streptosporangiaceae bacterium]
MQYLASLQQPSNPLVPSVTELVVGAIAFFIVFGALWKILLPRIMTTLEARTDAIEGGLKRAEEAQAEANRVLGRYQAQLAEAKHEAAQLREEAREQGVQILAELRAQGAAEKQRLVESATAQIEAERQQAVTALRAEIGTLAVELAGRVVGESLADEARQRRTVDRFLAELEAQAGGPGVRAGR